MTLPSQKRTGVAATDVQERPVVPEPQRVARLVVVEGPNRGAALALVRAQATVGRHPTNDLVLSDPRVSSVHLEVVRRPGGRVLVRDAGSTNGSWIGDHRLFEAELFTGATLRVGDTLLRVDADEGAAPVQAAATHFEGLLGSTSEMRELFAVLERVATKPLSVLVQGDTGTGKEEVARAIHSRSG